MSNRSSRRALVAGGIGASAISIAAIAKGGHSPGDNDATGTEAANPTGDPWATEPAGPTEVPIDKTEYTGRYFGAHVTWDLETYAYTGDETTLRVENEDDLLFLTPLKVYMVTMVEFRFQPDTWHDLDEAIDKGYQVFADEFSGSNTTLVGAWSSDEAAGFLVRFSDYSQDYVEYTRTSDSGLWCRVRYQASYNDADDLEGTAESLVGAWIEGEPMVRAVDPEELLATIVANA